MSIKFYLYLAMAVGLIGGAAWFVHHLKQEGAQQEAAKVAIVTGKEEAQVAHQQDQATAQAQKVVEQGQAQAQQAQNQSQVVTKTIIKYIHDKPSAPQCVIQPDVRQALQDQVDKINKS